MSRLRSNKVVNQAGSGAPELTYGAVVPGTGTISGAGKVSIGGSITAASFHGDGSQLSGISIDSTALKDSAGGSVKAQAISTGVNITGNLAATGNVSASGNVTAVDGTFSGNLTVQGTTTTIDTAVTSVDSLAVDGQITGLGNLGIGTVNPVAKTHIVGSSGGGGKLFVDTLGTFSGTDTSTLGFSVFRGGSNVRSNSQAEIVCEGDGNYSGSLVFKTQTPGTYPNSLVERLRFTSTGNVGINSATPRTSLDIGSTDALVVPVGTTAQRPTAAAGMFRYNTTEGKFEGYTTEWGEIGGGGASGITTEAHVANNATVTLDLTAAQDHKVTATGTCTITCTGGTEAVSHTIRIINNGSATINFSNYFLFPSGNTPSLPTTDGAISLISFTVNRVGSVGVSTQLLTGASLNFS